jgi:amidase
VVLISEIRANMALLQMVMGEAGANFLGYADEVFEQHDTSTLMHAFTDRNRVAREWNDFLHEHDVLLLPTWAQPPFELGFDVSSVENAKAVLELMRPVLPGNVLGLPGAVVPVGMADGTPVGAQLMARRFADLTTLRAAAELEARFGVITPIDPRT